MIFILAGAAPGAPAVGVQPEVDQLLFDGSGIIGLQRPRHFLDQQIGELVAARCKTLRRFASVKGSAGFSSAFSFSVSWAELRLGFSVRARNTS